jgi:hypothetical protein
LKAASWAKKLLEYLDRALASLACPCCTLLLVSCVRARLRDIYQLGMVDHEWWYGTTPALRMGTLLWRFDGVRWQPVSHPLLTFPVPFASLLRLSGMTTLGWVRNVGILNIFSLVAAGGWCTATFTLSRLLPRKAQAQRTVEARLQRQEEDKKSK